MNDVVKAYLDRAYGRVEQRIPSLPALPTVQLAPDLTLAQKYIALCYGQPKRTEEIPALDGRAS